MKKRIEEYLLAPDATMQSRMFLVGGSVGCALMAVMFLVVLMSGQSILVGSALGAGAVLLFAATVFALRTKRYTLGSAVVILILNGLVTPLGYFTGGGAMSGSPAWFVVCGMFVFALFKGKLLAFFLLFSIGVFGGISLYGAYYPESIIPLAGGYAGVARDTFLAAAAACILAGIVLRFQEKLLERQNRITEEQKREIEALNESQNRFFSSMSHEIRTPINTIIGLNEITLREQNLPAEVMENAIGIQNASKMLLSLINDILDLSRIQSGSMEVVESQYETTAMLSEIVNLLWNRAREKGLRFDIHIGDAIPSMLYGDEMRVKQVIVNLLTNAIKYTSEGSVLLNVGGKKTDTNRFLLQIDVEDTGIGIRKEAIPYLFDTFKRIEDDETRAIEGTGLGLSIAKQLVELMDGTISVDSIYTKGSTFRVELPQRIVNDTPVRYNQISGASQERPLYRQSFEAPEARVLIVDDNEMNRVVAGKLLRGTLVHVDLAASGHECLEKTAQNRYDVIFMDHEMPGMDGIETLEKIRSQANGLCREVPVVALTANAGSDRMRFYTDRGFQAYLAKPIHASLLEATLLQLLPAALIDRTEKDAEQQEVIVGRSVRKKPVIITTECVCDLPDELIQSYGIRMMPYYIVTEEGRFRDLTEIDADNLLQYLADGARNIRTEASDILEYESFFASCLTEAEHVIHLALGSAFDKGYANAMRAAESFGNVHVVDSGQLSVGLGMIALYAAKCVKSGKGVQEILGRLPSYADRVRMTFLVPDPSSMQRNRYASPIVGAVVKVFDMQPVFEVRKGKIRLKSVKAGYLESVSEQYIKQVLRNKKEIDNELLLVVSSGCSLKEREALLDSIRKVSRFGEIRSQKASATISAHCGLRSFGMAYAKRVTE